METTEPNSAAGGGAWRATRVALVALLLGGTAVVALHDWAGAGGPGLDVPIDGVVYDAVVLGAALACFFRAYDFEPERRAWLLIGLGVLFWGAAEVYWTIFIEGNPSAPYPSPADIGYILFYPLSYAGLVLLVRARADEMDWRLWMDGAIAALGTAALGTAFVFDFVAGHATGTASQVATTLAYPLGDIALLALIVGVIALTGWRPGRAWSLLLLALAAMAVADIAYTLRINGLALPGGEWVNPIYLISAVCFGIAVWQPPAARIHAGARLEGWRALMAPALFGTVMLGLFAMQYLGATSGLSTSLWAATMIAVIVRLAVSDRQNEVLLEQVQTDPLTGLGSRGRMQVDLERLAAAAGPERPMALLFLDLNGFKRYNDTFGHPAGDELLARLGPALRRAVGGDGTAYRVGGDEFCVLLSCAPERFEAMTRAAAMALTARGKGYDVGASWGMATVPGEATGPADALQLADVRMYAQKESRRVASDGPKIPEASDLPAAVDAGAEAAG